MAISVRDNFSPITQEPAVPMVRNEVGQPGFTFTVDGKVVRAYEGQTILSAAIDSGILDIPNLCNDEKLEPTSACRMCLVHIEGAERPLPSCNVPASPGMVVTTKSDELFHIRRTNLEMILSDHNAYCQPPCQKACRRTLVEEEIAICRMHGYAAEQCLLDPPVPFLKDPPTGKKVAIVGAGPAGLTCAYYLALKGHYCKIYDMQPQAGGMLRYGIPEYRLQKDIMDRELDHVWQLGVDLQCNVKFGQDFTVDDLFAEGFDAVYLAIGCWTSNRLNVPGDDAEGVVNAIAYLREKVEGLPVPVDENKEVVVIGGGFTTFDCTRTSLRLGAKVHTTYYRTRADMSATQEEVEDGEAEGTHLLTNVAQQRILTDENGKVTGVEY